jgi:hypothetical protein
VTLGATHEGMVAGDAVNTAARVQATAEPGQVLTDEATYRLAASAIGFAAGGSHRLKGKADPQRLWRATRVLSAVGGVQRVDGLEAPLTGRDAELRTLKELFHATAERQPLDVVPVQVREQDRPGKRLARQQRGDPPHAGTRIEEEGGRRCSVVGHGHAGGVAAVPDELRARCRCRPADTAECQPHRPSLATA